MGEIVNGFLLALGSECDVVYSYAAAGLERFVAMSTEAGLSEKGHWKCTATAATPTRCVAEAAGI